MSDFNKQVIEEFRNNDGEVGGHFKDMTLLLLHTTGAKSGKKRVNPVATIEDDGRLVIAASKGGAPTNPDWYHNLTANPEVVVEYGPEKFKAEASVASEPERTELYEKVAGKYPVFLEYPKKTDRTIPVVILSRLS